MQCFMQNDHVGLRLLTEDDAPQLVAWMNDPQVTQFLLRWRPITLVQELEWIRGLYQRDTDHVFGIVTPEDTLIGTMGLHGIRWIDSTATTGACIGNTRF